MTEKQIKESIFSGRGWELIVDENKFDLSKDNFVRLEKGNIIVTRFDNTFGKKCIGVFVNDISSKNFLFEVSLARLNNVIEQKMSLKRKKRLNKVKLSSNKRYHTRIWQILKQVFMI